MTMGPEPRIRIFEMSVRFGIYSQIVIAANFRNSVIPTKYAAIAIQATTKGPSTGTIARFARDLLRSG